MKFDSLGLPQDNGSTDKQDSARLAGLLTVFEWPKSIPLGLYLKDDEYVRHPQEYKYNFSRDQAICLMAGFCKLALYDYVDKKHITGKDLFSPSQNGHVRLCQGLKPYPWQKAWLWIDVIYSCYVKPLYEPNQLLCMMLVAEPKYLTFWLNHNKVWRESIRSYWSTGAGAWRNESELAEHMITFLESKYDNT